MSGGKREGAGRPTEYDKSYDAIARAMCRMGATNVELGEELCVTERTIIAWQQKHRSFGRACKLAKNRADDRMERALYEAGVRGDVQAIMKWLHNRRPAKWRDKQLHEITGPDGGPVRTIQRIERVIVKPADTDG